MRNPRIDPQPGDAVSKQSSVREIVRTVIARRNDNVDYSNNAGKKFTCWITTWKAWAQDAKVVRTAPSDNT